jgi:hypothetical protein
MNSKFTFKNLLITAIVIVLVGCTTVRKSGRVVYEPSVVTIPDTLRTKLTIDTSAKLEGISRKTTLFHFITLESPNKFMDNTAGLLEKNASLKQAAIFNALQGTKYDVLVMPKYVVTTSKSLISQRIVVKVTGYGAYQTPIVR